MENKKEIIEIRKLYLVQMEKFETKVFFSFLTLSITLLILYFKTGISYWYGLGLMLFTLIPMDLILQFWRKKSFNQLIEDINSGKIDKKTIKD